MVPVVVKLDVPSVASYRGGIAGFAATSPRARGQSRIALSSPEVRAYRTFPRDENGDARERHPALRSTRPDSAPVPHGGGRSRRFSCPRKKSPSSTGFRAFRPSTKTSFCTLTRIEARGFSAHPLSGRSSAANGRPERASSSPTSTPESGRSSNLSPTRIRRVAHIRRLPPNGPGRPATSATRPGTRTTRISTATTSSSAHSVS